MTATQLV